MLFFYRVANDAKIAIHGKRAVKGYTKEGSDIGMVIQIADVKQTFGSVRRLCEAGNRVVFDYGGSCVENKFSVDILQVLCSRKSSHRPQF